MKKLFLGLAVILAIGTFVPLIADKTASADVKNGIQSGFQATGADTAGDPEGSVNGLVETIVNILSWLVGVISVIMVIVGGFKYVTSGGDSGKVSSAKNTILYAVIGLVIVALSQVIVQFVLKSVT